jgi:hypothetical protein
VGSIVLKECLGSATLFRTPTSEHVDPIPPIRNEENADIGSQGTHLARSVTINLSESLNADHFAYLGWSVSSFQEGQVGIVNI